VRPFNSPRRLAILIGYGLGAFAWLFSLPSRIPPVWPVSNHVTIRLGTWMVAFLLPTAAALASALIRRFSAISIVTANAACATPVCDTIATRAAFFIVGLHALILARLTGIVPASPWIHALVPAMLGITFISIGNLLPRTRPNLGVGIRTRETLSDRARWIRTHRYAGYLTVGLGIVVAVSAIVVPAPIGTHMIIVAGPIALAGAAGLAWRARRRSGAYNAIIS